MYVYVFDYMYANVWFHDFVYVNIEKENCTYKCMIVCEVNCIHTQYEPTNNLLIPPEAN